MLALLAGECALAPAGEGEGGLRAALVVDGRMGGADLTPAEQAMAAKKLEGALAGRLQELLGCASFDQAALEKVRAEKEQWAALTGAGAGEVQRILRQNGLDAVVRCYFRTATAYRAREPVEGGAVRASANLMLEIISLKTGEKGALVWSPLMGSLDAKNLHALQGGNDEFEAGMNALVYAAGQVAEKLSGNPELKSLVSGAPAAAPAPGQLRVAYLVQGRVKGEGVNEAEGRLGGLRLEALLANKLRDAFGIRAFDESALAQARKNAEQWKALEGGGAGEVRQALAQYGLDAVVRVYYRTAPAYRVADKEGNAYYSGTASVMAEVISLKTGEKSVLVESPPMGTEADPARRAFDPFDSGMAALDYATDRMVERLKESPAARLLRQPEAAPTPESGTGAGGADAAAPLTPGARFSAMFAVAGEIGGDGIFPDEQSVGRRRMEAVLDRKLAQVLNLGNFDGETLAKVRRNAEEWAVLLGDDPAAVAKVLEKYNVDCIVRVKYKSISSASVQKDKYGNAIYYGVADVAAEIVSRKTGRQKLAFASPAMGTDANPALSALDPFDAGLSALDCATEAMVAKLQVDLGVKSLMGEEKAAEKKPDESEDGKPTVAVLWVRPTFTYWRIPRSTQPGLNVRKRKQMQAFVDHCKSTGKIGVEVADYLVSGLTASGAFVPIESSAKAKEQMGDIADKIAELRMAGWAEATVPADPLKLSQKLHADYVVTAEITKISESSTTVSAPLISAGDITAEAEVSLTVTNAKTGQSATFSGSGSFKKSGYGTFMSFDPAIMKLDKMLIGGAVKEAIVNAAGKVVAP